MHRSASRATRGADLRLDVLLVVLFVAVVGPFVQTLTAQGSARYLYSAALVEHQTVELDRYEPILGKDRVESGGHVYSDKAPAQPILGAAVLGVAEFIGADPATEYRVRGNLGLWSQSLVFATIPGALLLVLLRRHSRRHVDGPTALVAAGGLVATTIVLPLSSHLYGHVMAAVAVFAAWHLLTAPTPSLPRVAMAGALAALACATEYPVAIAAAIIGVWVLARLGWRAAAAYGTPLVLGAVLVVAHNRLLFDSSTTGYTAKSDGGRVNFLGTPDLGYVARILAGERGFVFTPIVLVGLAGLWIGLRERRRDLWVPAAIFAGYLWLQAGWSNPWGGEGPGPRYMTTALPFLVVPIALVLPRLRRITIGAVLGVGAVSMGLAVLTLDLVPHGSALIVTHLDRISADGLSPTIFTMALGPAGWLVHLTLIGWAAFGLYRHLATPPDDAPGIGGQPAGRAVALSGR